MCDLVVLEPLRVKQQVIKSANGSANMILKIDDLIAIKGGGKGPQCLQAEWRRRMGGMGGMGMGGMPHN